MRHISSETNLHRPEHLGSFELFNIPLKKLVWFSSYFLLFCFQENNCWKILIVIIVTPTWTIVNCFSMACLSASRAAITWHIKNMQQTIWKWKIFKEKITKMQKCNMREINQVENVTFTGSESLAPSCISLLITWKNQFVKNWKDYNYQDKSYTYLR